MPPPPDPGGASNSTGQSGGFPLTPPDSGPTPGSIPPPPGAVPGTYAPPPMQPPGYTPYGQVAYSPAAATVKGPRPDVKVGGGLIVLGSILSIVAVFLPWADSGGQTFSGLDDYFWIDGFTFYNLDAPGVTPIVVGIVMAGLGITLIAAGRVLAVAIIAIVGAAIASVIGIAMIGLMTSFIDAQGGNIGFGVILQPIAPLLSLAGAIAATAKRRRPTPVGPVPMGPGAAPPPPPPQYGAPMT